MSDGWALSRATPTRPPCLGNAAVAFALLMTLASCTSAGAPAVMDAATVIDASGAAGAASTGGRGGGAAGGAGGVTASGGGGQAAGAGAGGTVVDPAGSGGQAAGGGSAGTGTDAGAGGELGGRGGGTTGGGGSAGASGGRGGAPVVDAGGADRMDAAGMSDGSVRPARVLLYSFSTLDIPSVPAQLAIFKQKLEGWQYQVDQSKDPAVFTDTNLARYAAVGMINTCFFPFGANNAGTAESQALQRFVQAGGGLFGTHCADVTFQSVNPPPLYNQLIGGRANSDNYTGDNACRKLGDHPTIAALPGTFTYNGNLDNAAFVATDSVVLVKCKFGGGSSADTAVSWVRNEGAGRVFFTSFGKVDKDLTDATIGDKHIVAGLGWVLGR